MNTFGQQLRFSVFGESHGPAIGGVLDGVPAGMPVDLAAVQARLDARRPGTSKEVSARDEPDKIEVLSGIHDGHATGAPLAFIIRNHDARSQDYANLANIPRPGHADLTEHEWSRGHNDKRGGGHRSGRLTAPMVAAAAFIAPLLQQHGIQVTAKLAAVGDVESDDHDALMDAVEAARQAKDSIGGRVAWEATGVPPLLGAPMMQGVPSHLGQLLLAIPGVKAVEFGEGVRAASMRGSEHNDAYRMDGDQVKALSNHAGGILGGRTTGEPLWGQVAFKPSSSIPQSQQSVDLSTGEDVDVKVTGRHDPCIAVRGAPVVQACVELAIADLLLLGAQQGHVPPHAF